MKGVVYEIRCNITGEVYYGSTYYFERRMRKHRAADNDCNSKTIISRGDYTIRKIFEINDICKEELEAIEKNLIKNNPNINRVIIAGASEAQKKYYRIRYAADPIIECACGSKIKKWHYNRHCLSKKHINFAASVKVINSDSANENACNKI